MKETVFVNTTKGEAWSSNSGGQYDFRPAVAGEIRKISLRFIEEINDIRLDVDPNIQSMQISVGLIDARPTGGYVRYQFGSGASNEQNTTAPLAFNHNIGALRSAIPLEVINEYGEPKIVSLPGSVGIIWDQYVLITPRENRLRPLSFVRVHAYELVDGSGWMHELRMVQAPLAQTTAWVKELPPAPSVETIRDGGADNSNTFLWSEIQDLTVPAAFRGTYSLRNPVTLARTDILSTDDDADSIAEQLAKIYPDGTVKVTNPKDQAARLEWTGDYIGQDIAQVEVFVDDAPEGDPTFSLDFRSAHIYSALRDQETFNAQLEVRAIIKREDNSEEPVILFRSPFSVTRDQNWDGMSSAVTPLWLRPPTPIDYVPYTDDQVIIGDQHYVAVIGDGVSSQITIDHNLNSEDISGIVIRENDSPGAIIDTSNYSIELNGVNSLSITFDEPPSNAGLVAIISVAGPVSAFQAHTHTQEQIVGLVDLLENLAGRIDVLEEILPSSGPAASTSNTTGTIIKLPQTGEVLFAKSKDLWKEDELNLETINLLRPPPMLPAVHNDSPVDPLPDPLPLPIADTVYVSDRNAVIPIGGGIRSQTVHDGNTVASDGRYLYAVRQSSNTNSYYPTSFERTLFALAINEKMLAVNRTFEVAFGVQSQLVKATCQAQWVLSIQLGVFTEETTPAPIGLNLEFVNWGEPIFEQILILSSLMQSHSFGLRIRRKATEFLLDQQLYGVWSGNNSAAPNNANFAVRAMLSKFDTENRDDPRGFIAWRLVGQLSDEGKENKPPQAIIY